MSDCRKCADFDWCAENEDCGLFKPKPQTNADRIRGMSDEELARFLSCVEPGKLPCPPGRELPFPCEIGCKACWMDWLKATVEVDDGKI